MHAGRSRAELAALALGVAEEAAAVVLKGYRSRPHADEKGRADLVTEFDRASERLILARLAELTPNIPIVAEEATAGGGVHPRAGLVWYVDPLDGTTNFVHGHPFWCVAVGLAEDNRPIAGAVVAPVLGTRWTGWIDERGGEATRDGARCVVSPTTRLASAMLGTGFPPIRDVAPANNFDAYMAVKKAAQAVRRCGSAAIDLCFVGDGTYDGYWERALHAWDDVAAGAVALAGGARITSLDGGPADFLVGHIVASNGLIHDELVRAIGA